MFKIIIYALMTVIACNAQYIKAPTGGYYDLRGLPATGPEEFMNNLKPSLRERALAEEVNSIEPVPCSSGSNKTTCVCPGKCLTYIERSNAANGCFPNDCWKWDDVNDECVADGHAFVPAIILQSIPLTGTFGSGWGNIERWDIFAIYLITFFGGLLLLCFITCCASSGEDSNDCGMCIVQCLGLLWGLAMSGLWIWGIVAIAEKPDAPWTNWEGKAIKCPLI